MIIIIKSIPYPCRLWQTDDHRGIAPAQALCGQTQAGLIILDEWFCRWYRYRYLTGKYQPMIARIMIIAGLLLISQRSVYAQVHRPGGSADANLRMEIMQQDSLLFQAFNSKSLDGMKSMFSEDLEIYQDNAGFRSYTQTMESFGALFQKEYILTRTLLPASVEIYPIKDYGAIMTGSHQFCHPENGKVECATFKFVHIWKRSNGKWVLSRIVTYDH